MIYLYYIYLLSYAIFSGYCYYKDVIHLKYKDKINENYIKYKKGLPLVLFNLTVVSYPMFCLALSFYKPRPFNITESIIHIIVAKKISRFLFYFMHRLFHRIKILQKYHKVHHDFRYPIGMRAAYTHPIDFVFGNMIPLGITPFVLQVNIYVRIFIQHICNHLHLILVQISILVYMVLYLVCLLPIWVQKLNLEVRV